jgi:asparagine synthase (glutamine-hydrolysing)
MCGLAVVAFSEEIFSDEVLASVMTSMEHRGPDGVNRSRNDECLFIHARLSIIGLGQPGDQPITSVSGRWSVVFNGEIYNYKKLRQDYKLRNPNTSDGSVIPELLDKFGPNGLSKLEGMFAIVAFDNFEKKLLLSVDYFGIKPLYYFKQNNEIYVASEISTLLKFEKEFKLSKLAINSFLKRGSMPNNLSGYEDIFKIQNNSCLILSKSGISETMKLRELKNDSESKTWNDFNKIFESSVISHIESDVPIALLLSDGVDSNAIAHVLHKFEKPFTAVNVSLGAGRDESINIREFTSKYGTKLIVEQQSPTESDVDRFLNSIQRPTCDGFNTFLVTKSVKALGLKVALNGTGGDELFCGYPFHKKIESINKLVKMFRIESFSDSFSVNSANIVNRARSLWHSGELRLESIDNSDFLDHDNIFLQEFKSLSANDITKAELNRYLIPELIQDLDTFSMINSVEVRVPYISWELFDTITKIKNRKVGKLQFVKSFNFEPLYESYLRKKQGFKLPYESWLLRGPMSKAVDNLFHENNGWNEFINKKINYNKSKSSETNRKILIQKFGYRKIWSLVVLNKWLKNKTI